MSDIPREIERKFLLPAPPTELHGAVGEVLEQGYLAAEPGGAEVRLRRRPGRSSLTVKGPGDLIRSELEVPLSAEQFEALWPATAAARLVKVRHRLPLAAGHVDVDVYQGQLAGLVTAEVEFPTEEASERFVPPPFFGCEVTTDPRYKNRELARHGLPAEPRGTRSGVAYSPPLAPAHGPGAPGGAAVNESAAERPLLMIPGPVELSPAVLAAAAAPPPSHTAPDLIAAFGRCLAAMRELWGAAPDCRPFLLTGSGTLALEMAAANLVTPGERALVVVTGFFGHRMAEILRRYGAQVLTVTAPVGDTPPLHEVAAALDELATGGPVKLLCVTHVDTSTGVRTDPAPLARLARERGVLSLFDGVCALGGEPVAMGPWDADVYVTASQKALSAPPGLGLLVASRRALQARRERAAPPPLYLDWEAWIPGHDAYEEGRAGYVATPATGLVLALDRALAEILAEGVAARVERHRRVAAGLAAAWRTLGLEPVPRRPEVAAHTLSTLYLPEAARPGLVAAVARAGVTVAGGLCAEIRDRSFRVGHMGYAVTRPDYLERTVRAVAGALAQAGLPADGEAAVVALQAEVP
jgi:alanine-glyoxylate transaminase/serine-glyoxylate transaminase/serine-pyruvate transaminase